MPHGDSLLMLLVQIGLILALSRIMGMLFARLQQPQVMGEMVAGILLGPSFLAWVAPPVFDTLFPPHSIEYLNLLSQVGVIFFLFLIGLEFDPKLISQSGRSTLLISQTSIIVPFVLGVGLSLYLHKHTDLFGQVPVKPSALFMGAAMSVTAFPVLARILTERNLHKTRVGAVSIACAAANDATAWCILAFVVAVAQLQGTRDAVLTAVWSAAYVLFMLFAVRPSLRRLGLLFERQGRLSQNLVAVIFLLVLASAYVTQRIGIHALFGAFLIGAIMPKGTLFVRQLSEKLEDFTVVFLLPIFFAFAGLQARINLLNDTRLWGYTALVIAVACAGKFGGAAIPARLGGMPVREAAAVGVLMNTRGLMELVILNVGLQLGVISDTLFAMMLLMALVTTALTTPLLRWIYPFRLFRQLPGARPAAEAYSILIPVSLPRSGQPMAYLADLISNPATKSRRVIALYLRRPVDHEAYRAGLEESSEPPRYEPLEPLLQEAAARHLPVQTISYVTRDVAADITAEAQRNSVNLVLMGFHKPVIGQAILGGTVHRVLTSVDSDVAIFVDRGLRQVKRILVPYLGSRHDRLAMILADRIARSTSANITVLHVVPPHQHGEPHLNAEPEVRRVFNDPAQPAPVEFRVLPHDSPADAVIAEARAFDLVVIGVAEEWGLESHLFGWRAQRIARDCPSSLLIVRAGEKRV